MSRRPLAAAAVAAGLLTACGSQAPVLTVEAASAPPAAVAPRPASWAEVVADVGRHLDLASAAAGRADAVAAKEAVYDAYFVSFEALGMETAIRENLSARRAFELEEMFASLRKALHEGDGAAFEKGKVALLSELGSDASALTAAKVALP